MNHIGELINQLEITDRQDAHNLVTIHLKELCEYKPKEQRAHIVSQYDSLVKSYFKPYEDNSLKKNIHVACDKAYQKLQTYE